MGIQWSLTITQFTFRGLTVSQIFLVPFDIFFFFTEHCVLRPDWSTIGPHNVDEAFWVVKGTCGSIRNAEEDAKHRTKSWIC